MNETIPRHQTALNRDKISRPIRLALESNLIEFIAVERSPRTRSADGIPSNKSESSFVIEPM